MQTRIKDRALKSLELLGWNKNAHLLSILIFLHEQWILKAAVVRQSNYVPFAFQI